MHLCLIAYSWLDPWTWLALLAAILGLGFVIFVHELGHFLVAKACGVKVEKFYLGFDIRGWKLWKFRRGETEYGIGVLPLGGYVKMLGQEDNPAKLREEVERAKQAGQQPAADKSGSAPSDMDLAEAEKALYDPRSYLAKSVPQRMAIISAGVIMNLIFAWFMAIAAFGFGVRQIAPEVGQVVPGDGAWQSGLTEGPKILEIEGKAVKNFRDILERITLGHAENGIDMVLQGPDGAEIHRTVKAMSIGGRPAIGITSPTKPTLAKADEFPPVVPGSAAEQGTPSFEPRDKIIGLDGRPMADCAEIHRYLAAHADQEIAVTVERPVGTAQEEQGTPAEVKQIVVRVPPETMRWLGVVMEMGEISAIRDGSPAEKAGIEPGDVLRSVNGHALGAGNNDPLLRDPMTVPAWFRLHGGESVTLGMRRGEEDRSATVELLRTDEYAPPIVSGSPLAVPQLGIAFRASNTVADPGDVEGLRAGDVIAQATVIPPEKADLKELRAKHQTSELDQSERTLTFDAARFNWAHLTYAIQTALPGTTVELQWSRDGETHKAVVTPSRKADWFSPERGFVFEPKTFMQTAKTLGEAVRFGTKETVNDTLVVYRSLQKVGSGKVDARNFGGPISIFEFAIAAARQGAGSFLIFLTLLSANLAVINFLPIPVLDGGHMVFLAYEGIRGKPADERVQLVLTYMGLLLILALMVFVLGLDLRLIPRPGR